MKIALLVGVLLAVLVTVVLFSTITIIVHYRQENEDDHFTFRMIALFGIISKTFPVPIKSAERNADADFEKDKRQMEKREEGASFFKRIKANVQVAMDVLYFFNASKYQLRRFLRKTAVREFVWNTTIGTKDAALTGKLTGALWSAKGVVQMLLYQLFSVRCQPSLQVSPLFQNRIFYTELHCIFSVRVGEAILTAIQLLRYWKQVKAKTSTSIYYNNDKTV